MKNAKKLLALMLVFVMILGIGTMGASAAFETETIKYSTPVQVMAGMGILVGDENGNFNPSGNLTRAAAAKIVAYVALGKEVADKLPSTEVFKDLKTNDARYGYAAKFVAYLFTKGIVNGYGDGNFGPGDSVTVMQFAKMLLSAIGYGKNNEYIGTGWDTNVLIDASNADIILNFEGDTDRVITREEASLFAFNTLTQDNAKVAKFDSDTKTYDNTYTGAKTLGELKYALASTLTGFVTANQTFGNSLYTVVTDNTNISKNFNTTTDKNMLGHYVQVYYKATVNADGSYTTYNIDDIGTAKTYTYNPYSTVSAATQQATALGVTTVSYDKWMFFNSSYVSTLKTASDSTTGNGTYILYQGKVVSYIASPTYTIGKVTAINKTAGSESITVNGVNGNAAIDNKAALDKVIEYTDITVGDYVTVTDVGGKFYLVKNTTVEGTISSISKYTYNGTVYASSVVLDGKTYYLSSASDTTDATGLNDVDLTTLTSFNGTYVLYLDANGKIYNVKAKEASADTNLFYCTGAYVKSSSDGVYYDWMAKGVNAKGEAAEYKIAASQTTLTITGAPTTNTLYYISAVDAFTGVATFSAVGDKAVAIPVAGWSIKATGTNKYTVGSNYYYLSSDVSILYVSDSFTSKSYAPTVTKDTGAVALNLTTGDYLLATPVLGTNNYTVHTIIRGQKDTKSAASLAYIYSSSADAVPTGIVSYTGATGTLYANTYTAYIDGVKKTINVPTNKTAIAKGFYTYTVDTYGLYTLATSPIATGGTSCGIGTFENYYNGVLSLTGYADMSVTNAVLVNCTGNTYVPTDVALLSTADTLAVDFNALGTAIDFIYVIASTRVS